MFLITDFPSVGARSEPRSDSRVSTVEHIDSLRAVDLMLAQFESVSNYMPGVAGLSSDRWASSLRTIGLATLRAQSEGQESGRGRGEFPILDRLAIGLIEQLFRLNYGGLGAIDLKEIDPESRSRRTVYRRIAFKDFVDRLNNSHVTQADRIRSNIGQFEFTFRSVSKTQRLILLGDIDGDGRTMALTGVKLKGRGSPVNQEALSILRSLDQIIRDQTERRKLAELCRDTAPALAPSKTIVGEIERNLRIIGLPVDSYDRSSLGAGVFPHSRYYHNPISGSGPTLIFYHCDRCHSLRRISAEDISPFMVRYLEKQSASIVEPWHQDICGKTVEQVDSNDMRDRKLRELRARMLERKKLEKRFQSSGDPDILRRQW